MLRYFLFFSIKCVMDGDEKHFDLFSCTAFLLQNLDIEVHSVSMISYLFL